MFSADIVRQRLQARKELEREQELASQKVVKLQRIFNESEDEMVERARVRRRERVQARAIRDALEEEEVEARAPVKTTKRPHSRGTTPLSRPLTPEETALAADAVVRGLTPPSLPREALVSAEMALDRVSRRADGLVRGGGSTLKDLPVAAGQARAMQRRASTAEEARWEFSVSQAARRRLGREGRLEELRGVLARLAGESSSVDGGGGEVAELATRTGSRKTGVRIPNVVEMEGYGGSSGAMRVARERLREVTSALDETPAGKTARFAVLPAAGGPSGGPAAQGFRATSERECVGPRMRFGVSEPRTAFRGGGLLDEKLLGKLRTEWISGLRPTPQGANLGKSILSGGGGSGPLPKKGIFSGGGGSGPLPKKGIFSGGGGNGPSPQDNNISSGASPPKRQNLSPPRSPPKKVVSQEQGWLHGAFRSGPHCDLLRTDRAWKAWASPVVSKRPKTSESTTLGGGTTAHGVPIQAYDVSGLGTTSHKSARPLTAAHSQLVQTAPWRAVRDPSRIFQESKEDRKTPEIQNQPKPTSSKTHHHKKTHHPHPPPQKIEWVRPRFRSAFPRTTGAFPAASPVYVGPRREMLAKYKTALRNKGLDDKQSRDILESTVTKHVKK